MQQFRQWFDIAVYVWLGVFALWYVLVLFSRKKASDPNPFLAVLYILWVAGLTGWIIIRVIARLLSIPL